MKIDILCSGSKGNATIVRSPSASVLIDCGAGTVKYIKEAMAQVNLSKEQLDAVLITHSHSDHIRQLRYFSDKPIYSYCPLSVRNSKKELIALDLHPIVPLESFQIGDLTIIPLPLSHDSGPTCGFLIHDDHERLIYITDTGYIQSDLLPFLRGADYIIMEANHDVEMLMHTDRPMWLKQRILSDTGHLNNQNTANILTHLVTPRTKEVVLAHLSEEANTPELALDAVTRTFSYCGISMDTFHLQTASQNQILSIGEDPVESSAESKDQLRPENKIEMKNQSEMNEQQRVNNQPDLLVYDEPIEKQEFNGKKDEKTSSVLSDVSVDRLGNAVVL